MSNENTLNDPQWHTLIALRNGTYTPDGFEGWNEVEVKGAGNVKLGEKTVTVNGNYEASNDGLDGYSAVNINISGTSSKLQERVVTIQPPLPNLNYPTAANMKTKSFIPEEGYDGLSKITINIPQSPIEFSTLNATENGTYTATGSNSECEYAYKTVQVNVQGGQNVIISEKDVNFYDYEGTVVYSYTTAEFLALSTMPSNPSHSGLIAQGWNWSFEGSQEYVSLNGCLDVGQMYVTSDGKTRIYIHFNDGDRLSPQLCACINGSIDVDWGDGTEHYIFSGDGLEWYQTEITPPHVYQSPGDYIITLHVINGEYMLANGILTVDDEYPNSDYYGYKKSIFRISIGNGMIGLFEWACYKCTNLKSISIPNTVLTLDRGVFGFCQNLKWITIPSNLEFFGKDMFQCCYGIKSLSIPNVKAINLENTDNTFNRCYNIERVYFQDAYPIGSSMFSECIALSMIVIPNGVEEIESYAFSKCEGLRNIIIPESVKEIAMSAFQNIPFTSIHFNSQTPPTISNSTVFMNIPTDCIIYVPTGSLSAYTTAENYPDPTIYTYVEE